MTTRVFSLSVFLWFAGLGGPSLYAQCNSATESQVIVQIVPDSYPTETTWELSTYAGQVLATGTINSDTVCVPNNTCIRFTIFDSFGDGICCAYGLGSYTVRVDGVQVAQGGAFTFSETHVFGCQPGEICSDPLPLTGTGSFSAGYEDSWYEFTPSVSGWYLLDACASACGSGLWIYPQCPDEPLSDLQIGTQFYSSGGCSGGGAQLQASLAAGYTYLIRVGDINNGCALPLNWSLAYVGPVIGCMDTLSCNYDPAATIPGLCIYPGDPACPNSPDLQVVQSAIVNSLLLDSLDNIDACLLNEACLTGFGKRYLMRFTTVIQNIGTRDYIVGTPPSDPNQATSQFLWDPCHNHWHYAGYAEYLMFDTEGNPVPAGFKNGFCVMDLSCSAGAEYHYNCGYMGISAGCEDIYDRSLSCQWMDLTEIDTGRYTFVVRVNWDQTPDMLGYTENNYTNNWAQVCLHITRNANGTPIIAVEDSCPQFTDCSGELFGTAVPDCQGTCEGVALQGDLDGDTLRTGSDVEAYLAASLSGTLTVNACRDLNDDGKINVADAALSQDCALRGEAYTPPFGGVENHCEFPNTLADWADTATFKVADVNPFNHYADVYLLNPVSKLLAWQIQVGGVTIDSVKNLIGYPEYETTLDFDQNSGRIVALSQNESVIDRNFIYVPLVRVYFSPVGGDSAQVIEVCVEGVDAVTDDRYVQISGKAGDCAEALSTGRDADLDAAALRVSPNPFRETLLIEWDNADHQAFTLTLTDVTGRTVFRREQLRGSSYTLSGAELPAGVYLLRMEGKQVWQRRVVVE
ncbi:MAG: T9SS C-terminal target domain-containing protein [Bacteroidetes bacterium]|nr:MAG: T9SS C-terminal target domain-containing protein [Bacteroidota bacterium]